jgi:hypothetical protein
VAVIGKAWVVAAAKPAVSADAAPAPETPDGRGSVAQPDRAAELLE